VIGCARHLGGRLKQAQQVMARAREIDPSWRLPGQDALKIAQTICDWAIKTHL